MEGEGAAVGRGDSEDEGKVRRGGGRSSGEEGKWKWKEGAVVR